MQNTAPLDHTRPPAFRRRLAASGAALVVAALSAIVSVVAQVRTSDRVEQTLEVVRHSDQLLDDLLEAQGQFRLYAITRDSITLARQLSAAASAEVHLAHVRALTRSNDMQQRRLDALRDAMRDLGARRRPDRIPPIADMAAYLRDPSHVALRDSVSRLANALIVDEEAQLLERVARARVASVALVITMILALLLATAMFVWGGAALRRHDEMLLASEQRFRQIAEQNPDGVVLVGPSGIAFANRAASALLGVSDPTSLTGVQLWSFAHEEDRPAIIERGKRVMHGATGEPQIFRFVRRDGEQIELESRASPVPMEGDTMALVSLRDVTARRQVDARLRQAAKLEAVGTLAGGLAHDFNNLLAIIQMGAEMLRDPATFGPSTPEDAREILAATERGRAITRQLLSFARRNVSRATVFPVDALLNDSASFIGRALASGQQLDVEPGAPQTFIRADRTELELALVNLVSNARDVSPNEGHVILRTRCVNIGASDLVRPPDLPAGDYVLLQVHDAGAGVSPEARDHLFEPFFTTKPPGAGTGLGLATVYGIARGAGGTVTCESTPAEGTTFSIWLPIVDGPPGGHGTPASSSSHVVDASLHQRVLVVDDEDSVRRSVQRMLASAGFEVIVASSGHEALQRLAADNGRFDVLLTDFGMPGMTGAALIDAARVRYPWLRTVLMSGYTGDQVVRQTLHGSTTVFLQKPFEWDALVQAVAGQGKGASATE